jgi:hypothetical protein
MATYDAVISSGGAGSFTLRFVTSENTQEASNTSTVNYSLTIIKNSGFAFNLDPTSTWVVIIDSQTFSGNFSYDLRTASSVLIASGTTPSAIAHNADGSKSINVRGYFTGPGPLTGGDTGNQTMVLTNFVRPPLAPASCTVTTSTRSATVTSGVADVTNRPAIIRYEVERTLPDSASWSGTVNTMDGSRQFAYTNLDGGKTYKFRTRGVNSDGAGAWTESASTFVPAGGRRWDGSQWAATAIARRWNGSAWVDLTIAKRWDGSAWVDLT